MINRYQSNVPCHIFRTSDPAVSIWDLVSSLKQQQRDVLSQCPNASSIQTSTAYSSYLHDIILVHASGGKYRPNLCTLLISDPLFSSCVSDFEQSTKVTSQLLSMLHLYLWTRSILTPSISSSRKTCQIHDMDANSMMH